MGSPKSKNSFTSTCPHCWLSAAGSLILSLVTSCNSHLHPLTSSYIKRETALLFRFHWWHWWHAGCRLRAAHWFFHKYHIFGIIFLNAVQVSLVALVSTGGMQVAGWEQLAAPGFPLNPPNPVNPSTIFPPLLSFAQLHHQQWPLFPVNTSTTNIFPRILLLNFNHQYPDYYSLLLSTWTPLFFLHNKSTRLRLTGKGYYCLPSANKTTRWSEATLT